MMCLNACDRSADATDNISISEINVTSTLGLNGTASPTDSLLRMLQPRYVSYTIIMLLTAQHGFIVIKN